MNSRPFTTPFFLRFGAYALVLNGIWEFAQCFFLYDMKGWKAPTSTFSMAAAMLGDLAAAIVVICPAALSMGGKSAATANRRMLVTAVMLGALAGIIMEWCARVAHLWNYTALMP